ncbi:Biotin-protein ligase [Cordyceps fumosorosea ARSEF 2679]|uniref:Biotin-protein ligase n=1 Tax=Cordyceps fumosorosea (strain ARSEF 2679) TaxID=1081104 RepID=A0A167RKP0_CORFA|nr:Biotin-protein ligase [Cordyceps fumosorosea ARSEF 2679]OAA58689.1 Biotin-protein ligase [Cordyceps fumosorosea ARSEF 2679]
MTQFIGAGAADATRPGAFVYRGPEDDPDLSLTVGLLLESSSYNFNVSYVAPDDITEESLKTIKVFAFPGGEDVDSSWEELEPVADRIRDFVSQGGRYLGFCLGAYLAGDSPGLALLPKGSKISAESDEPDAQVKDDRDTVIQVNWEFSSGPEAGKTVMNRWVYYQEGNLIKDFPETSTSLVIGRYSTTNHVAATINKYGNGWVGTTGPHPEANQTWFDLEKLTAPDGLQFEIGHDLIEATMSGGHNVKNLAVPKPGDGTDGTNPPSGGNGNNGTTGDNGNSGNNNGNPGNNGTSASPKAVESSGSRRMKNPLRFFFRR